MASIFSKIISREIPADILYEDDVCLAFRDIQPRAPIHFLVIPKKEIVSVDDVGEADAALVGHLFVAMRKIAEEQGITSSNYADHL